MTGASKSCLSHNVFKPHFPKAVGSLEVKAAPELWIVELNAPFYSWPTAAAVRAWTRQADRRNFRTTAAAIEIQNHSL